MHLFSSLTILIIATSHGVIGESGKETGVWLEELVTPYYAFVDAGYAVDIVSIDGGAIPIDPRSTKVDEQSPASLLRYQSDARLQAALKNTKPLAEVSDEKYAALLLPGGHGTMWDFPESEALSAAVSAAFRDQRILAAVCHGPAGLLAAKASDGSSLLKGRRLTAFTNEEEKAVDLYDAMPFLLENRLKELGARFEEAPNFEAHVVVDGMLITGQNPASSAKVADEVIRALEERKRQ